MTHVVIPARNEAANVGFVIGAFMSHPGIDRVIVGVDADTTDATWEVAHAMGAMCIMGSGITGKGQVMRNALTMVLSKRVIFCDADITGLTHDHINHLLHPIEGMVLGVPEFPTDDELNATGQPRKWARRLMLSWEMVTGQRSMPTDFALSINDLHGYMAETQFNVRAIENGMEIMSCFLPGLHSPFKLTDKRLAEMERDRQWGIENGWLPDPIQDRIQRNGR